MAEILSASRRPPPSSRAAAEAMRADHPLMRSTPRRGPPEARPEARYQATALVSRRQVERRRSSETQARRPTTLITLLLMVSAVLALTWAGLLVVDRLHPGLIARARVQLVEAVRGTLNAAVERVRPAAGQPGIERP